MKFKPLIAVLAVAFVSACSPRLHGSRDALEYKRAGDGYQLVVQESKLLQPSDDMNPAAGRVEVRFAWDSDARDLLVVTPTVDGAAGDEVQAMLPGGLVYFSRSTQPGEFKIPLYVARTLVNGGGSGLRVTTNSRQTVGYFSRLGASSEALYRLALIVSEADRLSTRLPPPRLVSATPAAPVVLGSTNSSASPMEPAPSSGPLGVSAPPPEAESPGSTATAANLLKLETDLPPVPPGTTQLGLPSPPPATGSEGQP